MCVLILLTLLLVWCLKPVVFMPCKPLMVTCLVGGTGCCLLARVSAPLSTTKNLQPPNVGDSVGHQVSLDCFKAIRYQADSTARLFASMNCLTMSTKTGLSGSLERCSCSCQAWLDSLVVFVPVPTSCPSYCAKQAECEGDQCRAKSRHVTSGATISPRARQMEEQTQGNT